MHPMSFERLLRTLLRVAVLVLFAAYFGLVALKTPFVVADPEYDEPQTSRTQLQRVIENEPSDHLRTGSAALLLGLLVGNALRVLGARERRRFAVAIALASLLLIASTFQGLMPLATQPLLLLIALYGLGVAGHGFVGPASAGAPGRRGR